MFLYPGEDERDAVRDAPSDTMETLVGDNPVTWERTAGEILGWKPDLVVMPAWTFAVAPALGWVSRRLAKAGVECCVVVHNAFDHERAGWKDRLTRWQLDPATRFVTHNQALATELAAVFPGKPVNVFPHPIFADLPPAAGKLTRRRDLELLFFGIVRPYKGLDTLLEALSLVRRRDVMVTVAGEFWQGLDETRKDIEARGLQHIVDLVPRFVSDTEAADLFHRADAVVMPYRAVSGSGVVSSAYHYGRPVIASDLPGFQDVVEDGRTGWLFPANDPAALAAVIDGLDPEAARAAGNAAKACGAELSWARFADVVAGKAVRS